MKHAKWMMVFGTVIFIATFIYYVLFAGIPYPFPSNRENITMAVAGTCALMGAIYGTYQLWKKRPGLLIGISQSIFLYVMLAVFVVCIRPIYQNLGAAFDKNCKAEYKPSGQKGSY